MLQLVIRDQSFVIRYKRTKGIQSFLYVPRARNGTAKVFKEEQNDKPDVSTQVIVEKVLISS